MHLQGIVSSSSSSSSSSSEEEEEEETQEVRGRENPSGEENPAPETMMAPRDSSQPQDRTTRQTVEACTLDHDASRYVTPPRTLERLLSPVPATIHVPSPPANNDQELPHLARSLETSHSFPVRSMRFDLQSRSFPVSAASSVQAEPSQQEPETRDYRRDFCPNNILGGQQQHPSLRQVFHSHANHNQQYPPATNNKKTTAMAAGFATFIFVSILCGIRIGLMAGLFAAYAHDNQGIMGDISKAVGEIALITREKAIDINQKHKLVRRVKFALMKGWECATTIDPKNNAFKNLIEYGDVVLAKLVDAFHDPQNFQGHNFLREDMNNDLFTPFRDSFVMDVDEDDDVSSCFGMEPRMLDLSLQTGRISTRPLGMEPIELLRAARCGL